MNLWSSYVYNLQIHKFRPPTILRRTFPAINISYCKIMETSDNQHTYHSLKKNGRVCHCSLLTSTLALLWQSLVAMVLQQHNCQDGPSRIVGGRCFIFHVIWSKPISIQWLHPDYTCFHLEPLEGLPELQACSLVDRVVGGDIMAMSLESATDILLLGDFRCQAYQYFKKQG